MSMELPSQFEAISLTDVVKKRPMLPGLFKELFFRVRNELSTKFAQIEVVVRGRQLVPLVTDYEGGTLSAKTRRELRTVKTPRMNPVQRFSAPELVDATQPGAGVYRQPSVDLQAAMERTLVQDLDAMKDDIELTIECMCAQAVTGSLTVEQDGKKALDIDFQMPAENKIVLAQSVDWSSENADPEKDFEDWGARILDETGHGADVCIMGTSAWRAFRNNKKVMDALDRRRVEIGSLSPNVNKLRKGEFNGVDIYVYGGQFVDCDGVTHQLLDPNEVIMGATSAKSSIEFGVPEDLANHGEPNQYFSKSWEEENPSAIWIGIESRPLPIPKEPGAFVHATVIHS
ncbi:major capsid protein [Desulfobaculum bizertense]|nr:major capsid protein [Desulfobaculum bizertense]UIJ38512.1 major capsid protein [Desulfobaculum bizertense]UIJ38973.1 major capsid protein [Desulfobaculum bizertense]